MPTALPRLEADPLVLRAFRDEDVPLILGAHADPLIPIMTTVPEAPDLAAAQAFIARQHDRFASGEGYSFAIARASSGEALGQIGLWPLRDRHAAGRASVGYWVATGHRRRGIAGRALRAISDWGLGLSEIHRLELYVEPWNEASWRTAEHAGYEREGLMRGWLEDHDGIRRDMYMYSRLTRDPAPIRLEPWTAEDHPLLEQKLADPAMTVHLGGPFTAAQIDERQHRFEHLAASGAGTMMKIVNEDSGEPVGSVGYWTRSWDGEHAYEMGWAVLPPHQRRGIATAAITAAIGMVRTEGRHRFVYAFPAVDNTASNALCARFGFVRLGECEFEIPAGRFIRSSIWRLDLSSDPRAASRPSGTHA